MSEGIGSQPLDGSKQHDLADTLLVLMKTIEQLEGKIGKGVKAISLIKVRSPLFSMTVCILHNLSTRRSLKPLHQGVDVHGSDIHIFADVIEERLGVSCSALSGANIADEVAKDHFSETTIGYRVESEGEMWRKLFGTPFSSDSLVYR